MTASLQSSGEWTSVIKCINSKSERQVSKIKWALIVNKASTYNAEETQVQSLGGEDLLEKEMATHSRTLDWKIPWMEEPGRLQSMGSQRVRYN